MHQRSNCGRICLGETFLSIRLGRWNL